MNTLDVIFLSLMALLGFRGLFRGLVKEALSLGAIILGMLAVRHLSGYVAPHLAVHIQNPETVQAAAALVTFLGTVGLVWVAAKLLSDMLTYSPIGPVDKGLGFAFGLAEGYLACLAVLYLVRTVAPNAALHQESALAPLLLPGMRMLALALPDGIRQLLRGGA
ncbi:CvpA family protein [Paucidesulfovibrio longus]|uniref:CvpA family protein n=1 Tax=Paucidesulfovibrio longus TaxID=889 RepID=UPI0003B6ED96|nr:CvpA family protein [Paucidesulfovibrio longus]